MARRSATISTRRSTSTTPCAGWAPRSTRPIRRCRRARSRSPNSCRRRRSCRAASPRSAWSSAPTARGSPSLLKPGQRLVSRDGDLWRWDGFAADAHAPTGAARRLAQRSRLSDIDGELVTARTTVEDKRKAAEAAQSELTAAGAAEAAAREHWRSAQREADNARELHAMAEREMARNTARISALTEAKTRLIAGRDEAQAGLGVAESALAELPPSADLEGQLADIRTEIEGKRAAARRGARRGAGAGARGRARRPPPQRHRHRPAGLERPPRPRHRPDRDARHPQRRGQAGARVARRRAGDLRGKAPPADRRGAGAPKPPARAAADRLAEAENALGRRRPRGPRRARGARRRPRGGRPRRGARRRRQAPADRHRPRDPRDARSASPDAVAALAGIAPGDDAAGCRRRSKPSSNGCGATASGSAPSTCAPRKSCGEIETQHTTLTTERDDLVEAIARLRQGIVSLNKEARERLLSSFAIVNTHFQRLFTELFGGGTAELQLIENDDPLEAGLEIFAKPPGKKPATLSLLSGGEQALTALALIFAVFLTNPAPICVLDEVDAPLDDHNVERFCDLLDEMGRSTDTRFVIITHNPITMARMNRLYGVTMAERGISQLVSVDLEAAVKIRDSAA